MNTSFCNSESWRRRWASLLAFACLIPLLLAPEIRAQVDKEAESAAKKQVSGLRKEFLRGMKKLKETYREAEGEDERETVTKDRREFELRIVKEMVAVSGDLSDQLKLKTFAWYLDQKVKDEALAAILKEASDLTASKYAGTLMDALASLPSPSKEVVDLARKIATDASTDKTKGQTRMALVDVLSKLNTTEAEEEVDALLNECLENYAKVRIGKAKIGDLAKKKLAGRRFEIGKVAPDIVGVDLDDEKFKLSDYRGKIVVLDFWGDW